MITESYRGRSYSWNVFHDFAWINSDDRARATYEAMSRFERLRLSWRMFWHRKLRPLLVSAGLAWPKPAFVCKWRNGVQSRIWSGASEGGYFYSDELSAMMRQSLEPLTRFRQFCDARTND